MPNSSNRLALLSAFGTALLRRLGYFLLMGAWMGGFTFYALIVIPTAGLVLGGEREVGFITQKVTFWLNLIGLACLAYFAWNMLRDWSGLTGSLRRWLATSWIVMVAMSPGLFITHGLMDRLLESPGFKIHHIGHFTDLHTVYLGFATVQWTAAMLHIGLSLAAWRQLDSR